MIRLAIITATAFLAGGCVVGYLANIQIENLRKTINNLRRALGYNTLGEI